jgi:hypothetical protein
MNVTGTSMVILILAIALISGVSAQDVEIQNGYIVNPAQDLNLPSVVLPMSSGTISQGQTLFYSKYVPAGTTLLVPDLNWGDPTDSLTLTISAPDATLGPYSDASDGLINGRIYLSVSKPSGLSAGTWYFRVYGEQVNGVQSYSFIV